MEFTSFCHRVFDGTLTIRVMVDARDERINQDAVAPVRYFVSERNEAEYRSEFVQVCLRFSDSLPYEPAGEMLFYGAPVQAVPHWPDGVLGMLVRNDSPVWSTPE